MLFNLVMQFAKPAASATAGQNSEEKTSKILALLMCALRERTIVVVNADLNEADGRPGCSTAGSDVAPV